jgi:hypothetical protein
MVYTFSQASLCPGFVGWLAELAVQCLNHDYLDLRISMIFLFDE